METLKLGFNNFTTFLAESWNEVRHKVTWPSSREVKGTTLLVVITTLVFAVYLGALDTAMFTIVDWVFAKFA